MRCIMVIIGALKKEFKKRGGVLKTFVTLLNLLYLSLEEGEIKFLTGNIQLTVRAQLELVIPYSHFTHERFSSGVLTMPFFSSSLST